MSKELDTSDVNAVAERVQALQENASINKQVRFDMVLDLMDRIPLWANIKIQTKEHAENDDLISLLDMLDYSLIALSTLLNHTKKVLEQAISASPPGEDEDHTVGFVRLSNDIGELDDQVKTCILASIAAHWGRESA